MDLSKLSQVMGKGNYTKMQKTNLPLKMIYG